MPRRRATRTFYRRQLNQLRYLVTLARHESLQGPKFGKRRYTVTCMCDFCGVTEDKKGAVEALEFLCAHNHHSTYIKGVLTEGTHPDGEATPRTEHGIQM